MKAPAIVALMVVSVGLTLYSLWIPGIGVSALALLVGWVTVVRGRSVGAVVGITTGAVLDAVTGTPGRWSVALPLTALVCDALHRSVLAHPAPGVPALLGGAAGATATLLSGSLAYLVPVLTNARVFEPPLLTLLGTTLLAGAESALVVVLARGLQRPLRRVFGSIFYARQPL